MKQLLLLFQFASTKLKRVALIALAFSLTCLTSQATHIVGGEFAVTWVSGTTYHVKLNFYRDCNPFTASFDATSLVQFGFYDRVTGLTAGCVFPTSLTVVNVPLGNACYVPPGLCVERGTYEADVNIPANPNGYIVTFNRCCRNAGITNISGPGSTGNSWWAELPSGSLHNSTPVFDAYPAAYWCQGQIIVTEGVAVTLVPVEEDKLPDGLQT